MYNKLSSGKELQIEIEKLLERQKDLTTPTLSDFALLPQIKEMVEQRMEVGAKVIYYYLPVVVMLYCPKCFLGQAMGNGLRRAMAETMGIKTHSSLSHTWASVGTWLKYNKGYREKVDALFYEVLEKLNADI